MVRGNGLAKVGFDPARFVRKISVGVKGSKTTADYLEVKYRVMWLRAEHPDAHVETRIERLEGELVVMSALVSLSNGAQATGHGSCRLAEVDAVERAETTALGRALAVLGYGTQFALQECRVVDAPAVAAPRPAPSSAPAVPTSASPSLAELGETVAEVMPEDARAVPAWFHERAMRMPVLAADAEQVRTVAAALADALRERGFSTRQRGWLYLAVTGKSSGAAMDPRELGLLAQLVDRADVLREVADNHSAAESER